MAFIPNKKYQTSIFDEQIVTQRTPIIERKSCYPISNLRDLTDTTGSATISLSNGEYKLSTTASGTDSAVLTTTDIGRYMAHSDANCGMFLRLPVNPSGNQVAEWGLNDGNDKLIYGADATGVYIKHVKAGVEKAKVYSTSWDDTDGFVSSLDLSIGYIWYIEYAHYGGGNVTFSIWTEDVNKVLKRYILHTVKLDSEILLVNPNLPIKVDVSNNGTLTALDCYIGGRQYSVDGMYEAVHRVNGDTKGFTTIGTTPTLLASFRKKSGSFQNINVKVREFHITPDATTYWWIVKNNTLTTPSWGGLTNQQAGETALEISTNSTNAIDGIVIGQGHATGANKNEQSFTETLNNVLSYQQPVSVYIASKTATVSGDWTLDFLEEW